MHPIDSTKTRYEILTNINPGDLIHIETLEGSKYEVLVKSITAESVKGSDIEIPLDNIKTVKVEKISAIKTTGAIVGGYFASMIVIGFLFILAY